MITFFSNIAFPTIILRLEDNQVIAFRNNVMEFTIICLLLNTKTRNRVCVFCPITTRNQASVVCNLIERVQKTEIVITLVVDIKQLSCVLGCVLCSYRCTIISELNLRILFVTHCCTNREKLRRICKIVFSSEMTVVGQSFRLTENFRKFIVVSGNNTLINWSLIGLHNDSANAHTWQ